LIAHGDADKVRGRHPHCGIETDWIVIQVTSHKASEELTISATTHAPFFNLFQDGFHELPHEPKLKARLIDEVSEWIGEHLPANTEARL